MTVGGGAKVILFRSEKAYRVVEPHSLHPVFTDKLVLLSMATENFMLK